MKKLQEDIKEYLEERSWNTLRPGDIAKSIAIEAAELLEVFQWDNPTLEEVRNDPERIANIKKELADVLVYCFNMTVHLDVDTEALVREKLEKVKAKYPASAVRGNQEEYWKIKQEYRDSGKN